MENSLAVANFFIRKSFEEVEELTSMKLIKLVYISHGWYLALTGEPLLEERIQAWKYGPVVTSVYQQTKKYGKSPITSLFKDDNDNIPTITNDKVLQVLNRIWDVYGKYNGLQLSALTHEKHTPWDVAWNEQGGNKFLSVVINNDIIKDHYKEKMKPKIMAHA